MVVVVVAGRGLLGVSAEKVNAQLYTLLVLSTHWWLKQDALNQIENRSSEMPDPYARALGRIEHFLEMIFR